MNVVAYLLAFSNLQALKGRTMKDVSLKIGNLAPLCNDLKDYPEFHLEDFKTNRVNRVGNVGMYLSENLRQYCVYGRGSPSDEGVIISIFYKSHEDPSESDENGLDLAHRTIMISRGLSDEDIHPLFQEHIRKMNA